MILSTDVITVEACDRTFDSAPTFNESDSTLRDISMRCATAQHASHALVIVPIVHELRTLPSTAVLDVLLVIDAIPSPSAKTDCSSARLKPKERHTKSTNALREF